MWSSGLQRQIDYILVDHKSLEEVQDCEVTNNIDVCSDHRGLRATLVANQAGTQKRRKRKRRPVIRGHCLLDENGIAAQYHRLLDDALLTEVGDAGALAEAVVNAS